MKANIDTQLDAIADQAAQYGTTSASDLAAAYGEYVAVVGRVITSHVADREVILVDPTGRVHVLGLIDPPSIGTTVLVAGFVRRQIGEYFLAADSAAMPWADVAAEGPERFAFLFSCHQAFAHEDAWHG